MTDLRTLADDRLQTCPVTREGETWVVWGNAEARHVAQSPDLFSNRVSSHLSVPNGMDGEQHRRWRDVVDTFLADDVVAPLYPAFEEIAGAIVAGLPRGEAVDAVGAFGGALAVRAQSRWLGWPADVEPDLRAWIATSQAATRSKEPDRTAAAAAEFDEIIHRILAGHTDEASPTARLLNVRVEEPGGERRPLTREEIVSILRNWTAGDLGSIAASVGVICHRLAANPGLAIALRSLLLDADGAPCMDEDIAARVDAAIDEMLRIDDPFVSNRRVAAHDSVVAGVKIRAGERLRINWTAANRDPRAFPDPDLFDPAAHAADNLVWGAGPHACPGRTLATLELRAGLVAVLRATSHIGLAENSAAARAPIPAGGWAALPIVLS